MQAVRLRRVRKNSIIRDWVSEAGLQPKNLIQPYFVVGGENKRELIKSMPGVYHLSIDNLIRDLEKMRGIKAILLFGIASLKDEVGTEAYNKNGVVQRAIKEIKKNYEDLIVITDVCLCGYTSHGHCGVFRKQKSENRSRKEKNNLLSVNCHLSSDSIDNDETLNILAKIALSHAELGADLVAPSAMMDGQVKAIRNKLDDNGFQDVGILAYSAKYASSFYGPFREALHSTPQSGDRLTYQLDSRNADQALREVEEDIKEGADIVMVKPALGYLDIIWRIKQKYSIPIAGYNVSGEYAMIKAYCQKTKDRSQRSELEKKLVLEILTSIKRAGADFIITYHAKEAAKWLKVKS